jgi:BirA family biotin operon repressor/biotin-[acetyl-CoA-carboxylase] ligase
MNDGMARILQALHEADGVPCSGGQLSTALGVSRAQIWKHVTALRDRGYRIDGEPGGGYRLVAVPDRLFAEEIQRGLSTVWLGRNLHYFDEIDSTNRAALDLARSGAAHGTAVIAEAQHAGRGRLGRSFHSPAHQNLYTSIVLRPQIDTARAPTLLLAAGVAVAEAIVDWLGDAEPVRIKWPNDVLLGGRKTSGILMELGAEEARVSHAVLGIGVNLNVDPSTFPAEFRERATSLSRFAGRPVDRAAFTRLLYSRLEDVLDAHARGGLPAVRARFDAFFDMLGRTVTVHQMGDSVLVGTVLGLAESGALQIESSDGNRLTVFAGDVSLSPPADPSGGSLP